MPKTVRELSAEYDRLRAWERRTRKYYDDAPDGDPRKQEAVDTLARINQKIRKVEAKIDDAIEAEEVDA